MYDYHFIVNSITNGFYKLEIQVPECSEALLKELKRGRCISLTGYYYKRESNELQPPFIRVVNGDKSIHIKKNVPNKLLEFLLNGYYYLE